MDIQYKIEFFSDWHCGSGLAAGADVDVLVVKDKNRLPFVPGKTMKGLVREAVENILQFQDNDTFDTNKLFGYFDNKEKKEQGELFFGNAELSETHKNAILANNATDYLYRAIASTAIGEDGIAIEHSLRKMEVVVPCILEGMIHYIPEENKELIENGLKYIKRLGLNRNRGLGRCQITTKEGDKK